MDNFLLNQSIVSIWCNPNQDNQLIFNPKRISRPVGVRNFFKFLERTFDLPSSNKTYHVFNIGQIAPRLLGLLSDKPDWLAERWINFSEAINDLKLFCNIYNNSGLELPKFSSYYMFTANKSLLVAVEENDIIPIDYSNEDIYLRLYSNAYFDSIRSDGSLNYIYTEGKRVSNTSDILVLQSKVAIYKAKQGYVYCYVNGFIVDNIDMINCKSGDIAEFIYDSSVTRVVTSTIKNLKKFHSGMDNCYKYLITYDIDGIEKIEYHDDVDFFIYQEGNSGKYKGLYYNRNNPISHRMVTHRDYSITTDGVSYIGGRLSSYISDILPLDIMEMKVQVRIRNSGYDRPLVQDSNLIFELYKMKFEDRVKAMVSIDSTVDIWKASNLESSSYSRLMAAQLENLTLGFAKDAYGYSSICRMIADSPLRPIHYSGYTTIELPRLLSSDSTIYEYNSNGVMTGYYYNDNGSTYICKDVNTVYIEGISGKATIKPECYFGKSDIPVNPRASFRVYKCKEVNGIPDDKWIDITNKGEYVLDDDDHLLWSNMYQSDQYLMVRTDSKFLGYDLSITTVEGDFKFTLAEIQDRDGTDKNHIMTVPMGDLDIFLNGHSLIEGIDYVIRFPEVHILNKSHLNQPAFSVQQNLHIRFTGFCNSDLTMDPVENIGFIEHGVLSNNNKFDIREDQVLRITVDGSLKDRSDILFSEEHSGVSIVNILNGKPYQIKNTIVPIYWFTGEMNYDFRKKSLDNDSIVSDYLTLRLPQPERNGLSSINHRYPIVSPFLCSISYDLVSDKLSKTLFTEKKLSDIEIINICKPYEGLLNYELGKNGNSFDGNYEVIHPHNLLTTMTITVGQFWFLESINRLYFDNTIDLHPFFIINGL